MVIRLAVRLSVTLKEVPGADLLLTVCAHKVFRVPCAAHGGHHLDKQKGGWCIQYAKMIRIRKIILFISQIHYLNNSISPAPQSAYSRHRKLL